MSIVSTLIRSETVVDATFVTERLEAAGMTLLSLPGSGYSPRMSIGSIDVVRSAAEAYGWTDLAIKPPVPSAASITEMDEALAWLALIPNDKYVLRRIVGARMLVHPVSEKHLYSWRRVAISIGCDYKTIQKWHGDGIALIVRALR